MLIFSTGSVRPSSIASTTETSGVVSSSPHFALTVSKLRRAFDAREPSIVYGRRDMTSTPPARYSSPSPARMKRQADEIASIEDTQLFWTVTDCTRSGRPARRAATRAMFGAWKPWPTQPTITPSTASLGRRERSSVAASASTISASAVKPESERDRCPIGVRAPPATTMFFD